MQPKGYADRVNGQISAEDAAIMEFERVNFSEILRDSVGQSERHCDSVADLSKLAGRALDKVLGAPRTFFCPLCTDEYMFEFTLKDHLKRVHQDELMQLTSNTGPGYKCLFCPAVFLHAGLVPIHIARGHDTATLNKWRADDDNFALLRNVRENEPSIQYVACSPGLSDVFDKMDMPPTPSGTPNGAPLLKSILKKTPKSLGQRIIICSPSSTSIRRTRSEYVKRSLSVRRELRFDLPPPVSRSPDTLTSPLLQNFRRSQSRTRKWFGTARKLPTLQAMVTSTPNNLLDDISSTHTKQRPTLFGAERFQCARCLCAWENNAELLAHRKQCHQKGARFFLRPQYRCGQCGATFYRNTYLVRHCYYHHTPMKRHSANP